MPVPFSPQPNARACAHRVDNGESRVRCGKRNSAMQHRRRSAAAANPQLGVQLAIAPGTLRILRVFRQILGKIGGHWLAMADGSPGHCRLRCALRRTQGTLPFPLALRGRRRGIEQSRQQQCHRSHCNKVFSQHWLPPVWARAAVRRHSTANTTQIEIGLVHRLDRSYVIGTAAVFPNSSADMSAPLLHIFAALGHDTVTEVGHRERTGKTKRQRQRGRCHGAPISERA